MNIQEHLKNLRLKSNHSVNSLGKISNVSASHISRIENGERMPTPEILRKFSNVFNVDFIELLVISNVINLNDIEKYVNVNK